MVCFTYPTFAEFHMLAYLFDFDGTLVDSAPDLTRALDLALARAGLPAVGLERGTRMVGHGAGKLVERALKYTTGDQSLTMESPLTKLLLSVFLEIYEPLCAETSLLYPGAIETLRKLKKNNKFLALVTNKPRRFTEIMLPVFGLNGLFDSVVCGDDLSTKKPDPEMVEKVLNEFDISATDACLVGDSMADLGAAKRAGVAFILVSFGYSGDLDVHKSGADLVIDHLSEVLSYDA